MGWVNSGLVTGLVGLIVGVVVAVGPFPDVSPACFLEQMALIRRRLSSVLWQASLRLFSVAKFPSTEISVSCITKDTFS